MAQFPSTISGLPIQDGVPPGWTQIDAGALWTVQSNTETGYSDRVLTSNSGASSTGKITWDTPGVLTDQEILVLMKNVGTAHGVSVQQFGLRIDPVNANGYYFGFHGDSSSGGTYIRMQYHQSGGGYILGSQYNFNWTIGTWYWIRFRIQGTTVSSKIWANGSAEPVSWGFTINDTKYASGKICIVDQDVNWRNSIAVLSAASGGDTAGLGHVFDGSSQIDLSSVLRATAGIKFIANTSAVLDLTASLKGRFVAAPIPATAVLAATIELRARELFFTKWQTPAVLQLGSTLSAKAFVPYKTLPRTYVGDRYVRRYGEDYAHAFNTLLPTGLAWPRQYTTTLQKAIAGFAGIWGSTVERLAELLLVQESDPRSTVVLLPEWERAWGLPDPCIAAPQTIYARQRALVHKMTMIGGQSREFFIKISAEIGYTDIVIREWAPFMCGISMAGDTRMPLVKTSEALMHPWTMEQTHEHYRWEIGPPEMRFYWSVRVGAVGYVWFRASSGQSGVDHHLEFLPATDLECILRRWKPAHTEIIFDYSPMAGLDFSKDFDVSFYLLMT
jgi:uncharacterized protein YmfQ (DUF2313 family)